MSTAVATTSTEVSIRLNFDGHVPIAAENPQAGDIRLSYDIALNSAGTGSAPYLLRYITFGGPGTFQLTREGLAGVLDSTGALQGTIGTNYVDVTVRRRVVPLLTTPLTLSTSTLVERFASTTHTLGYFKLGTAECRGRSSTGAGAAASTDPQSPTSVSDTSSVAPGPVVSGPSSRSGFTGALATIIGSATPVDPTPYTGAHPNVLFASPSQNIQCYIINEDSNYASCVIARYDFPQPGPDCPDGATLEVSAAGRPHFAGCSHGQFIPTPQRVLTYGRSVNNGHFTCVSEPTGVTCADGNTDTGFTVSVAKFTILTPRTGDDSCPSVAELVAAFNAVTPPPGSTSASQVECASGWAAAGMDVDGNAEVGVFHHIGNQWVAFADRQKPCAAHEVPARIYVEACESG